ncbi:PREDICTED: uncharacterized protein LOC109168312 [Ipomoea nil]|uniref:uncharacterized protein LOC109168312 n=1 Tax=Ipomoea nil TaxID=35883 RepID=UPI000900E3CB|nr:PREDICTED: uncharacterized protein LOC109168312 [Ipomoea nil]
MWDVINNAPIVVMMVNPHAATQGVDANQMIPKPKPQLTSEEKTKCTTAKEIWDTLMNLGEVYEQEKENKLTMVLKKFEDFKMNPNETISQIEFRFMKLLGEISDLGKEPTRKEINLKILRGLPKSWKMNRDGHFDSGNRAEPKN